MNVMVYVDDPAHTFKEFRRVLKPSGKAHAFDSDFAMVAIDPVPPSDWRALLDAAARRAHLHHGDCDDDGGLQPAVGARAHAGGLREPFRPSP